MGCCDNQDKNSSKCTGGTVTVMACSGGSNVGQMTNEAAKMLDIQGKAKFFCLAGVGGHISGMVASVKGSDKVLVIDGCPVACGKKIMEAEGLSGYEYLMVTDLGIEKKHEFSLSDKDLSRVMTAAQEKLDTKGRCCEKN